MSASPQDLTAAGLQFLSDRHLATLTSLLPSGSPHVVPVGFTWDDELRLARVIAGGASQKVLNAAAGGPVALCQVDGRRWLTLEGVSIVSSDAERVAEAVNRYSQRYRVPRENPARVVIEILVGRLLGSADFFTSRA